MTDALWPRIDDLSLSMLFLVSLPTAGQDVHSSAHASMHTCLALAQETVSTELCSLHDKKTWGAMNELLALIADLQNAMGRKKKMILSDMRKK